MYLFKKYLVTWVDPHSSEAWANLEEILAEKPTIVEGIYYYLGKGQSGECFASEQSGKEWGNITYIPKPNIKSARLLK